MQVTFRDAPDMTIVTGATGWFGRALLAAITDPVGIHYRRSIRALVTAPVTASALGPGVEAVVGDVRRADGLNELFAGIPAGHSVDVIHAAGVIHPATTSEWVEVNARGTANIAAKARAASVRRLVHVSSNSPFGTNSHPGDRFRNEEPYHPYYGYGRSKMEAELSVFDAVEAGLDAVIVRPPWFYGPHQPARQTTFFKLVRTGRFPVIGAGDQMRSMVYVDNLVDGLVRAELVPTPPGRGWWIADSRPYSVLEIVETVGRALAAEGFEVTPNRTRLPAFASRIAETADALIQRRGR
jgi:nucleoside-diphosphate-sugar epimerase